MPPPNERTILIVPDRPEYGALELETPGTKAYTPRLLRLYDWFVLGFSNKYAWKCPTHEHLLPLWVKNFTENHLDLGVGTGYFPDNGYFQDPCPFNEPRELTLVDLNMYCLQMARSRVKINHPNVEVHIVQTTATRYLPAPRASARYSSISIFYLLHCLPGPIERKVHVFDVARHHLCPTKGVAMGATILPKYWEKNADGEYVPVKGKWLNPIAAVLMRFYNWNGTFNNWEDTPVFYERALKSYFEVVETRIVGLVFIFEARKPRHRPLPL
ncbi:uncharacterized protein E0L32_007876 [Thyridium curvatum]|uniref:Methyltransferase domain-containing protein n=1 Tax=Thyridium curvatum TaxID=1093900 RepID=A0A507AVE3_9PEZI|nr:uncharacterized protein E0L32_007876 [Thyridium curvatum]TPX11457.1 hypothetical protein E0L32_007876 [Thyridium curvatum]